MYDYHVHSHFSGDCTELMEDTVIEAIKKNAKQICFTDHIDYDYPEPYNNDMFNIDTNKLYQEIERLQKKYGHKILIQKGVELGLQTHIIDECIEFVRSHDLDFVLCSFHCCEKKDLYNGDYFANKSSKNAWLTFIDEMIETLNKFDDFSVVGHLDILKRYNDEARLLDFSVYKDSVEEVLKLIIEKNKGIEVNMSGLRSELNETLPNIRILEMYYDLGGKIITIGSDAHNKTDTYSHFCETLKALRKIGFKEFTIFSKMIPKQISIDEVISYK